LSAVRFVVVDASVALKWVFDDEDAVGQAVALRNDAIDGRFELVAPSLWLYEVTNGLVSAERRGRMDVRLGRRSLGHLMALGIELVDPDPAATYQKAVAYGLSAYDASYVALAEATETSLWSGDRGLCNAVEEPPGLVRWIGDYAEPNGL
jgi:predicted nucleic acid-binding protein